MQKINLLNVVVESLKPGRLPVLVKKLKKRLVDKRGRLSQDENLQWIRSHCSNFETLAKGKDPVLWQESKRFSKRLENRSKKTLKKIPYDLGGGGGFPYLYFLTRYLRPSCIVETGVAAGYSSCAFLSAIDMNGTGRLYSSDFPYFRLSNPEQYIGVLVDESLKRNWELYIGGDETNLLTILTKVDGIDFFHYDSDKSYSGRQFAISVITKKMNQNGLIVMDDIQDNSYFHDYIEANPGLTWHIFEFDGKYIGMSGELVPCPH